MANAVPLYSLSLLHSSSSSSATKLGSLNASSSLAFKIPSLHRRIQVAYSPFEGLRCNTGLGTTNVQQSFRNLQAEGRIRPVTATATSSPAPPLTVPKQKIRIKLRSYWVPLIEQSCKQILDAARSTNAKTMGPVPLPTKRRIYCVLKSPHVHKDAREHFEKRTHQRLIDVENPNAQTIDALMQLDIAAGVDVEVKLS